MSSSSRVFVKRNPVPGSNNLECEADGLELLAKHKGTHGLQIPEIIKRSKEQLELNLIVEVSPKKNDWRKLGEGLAKLHQITNETFGYNRPNYIGMNQQMNTPNKDWGRFFLDQRLGYQVGLMKPGRDKDKYLSILETKGEVLVAFLNAHKPLPSLLHGDLWSGNKMFDVNGPYLIDPAVYYGDRETDLALSHMFGGFDREFYDAYQKALPLPPGHENRGVIYNLYHYLNHLNLFGSSYASAVRHGFDLIDKLEPIKPQ